MGFLTIYRKTMGDLSNPKVLLGFYIPFLVITGMMVLAMSGDVEDAITLGQQETGLSMAFATLAFFFVVGFPLLALVSVFTANTIAKEAELGTLRILLSKPTRRWEILLATFAAIVSFSGLVALANLLLTAVMLYVWSGAEAVAISGGLFTWLAGHLAFALFGASMLTAVGLAIAVETGDRLKTALGTFVVPALYFGFLPIRIFSGDRYQDWALYLFDVNYHFGHVFVFLHDRMGDGFGVDIQQQIAVVTGVYELTEESHQFQGSLEYTAYIPIEVSVLLVVIVGFAALGVALYRFEQIEV